MLTRNLVLAAFCFSVPAISILTLMGMETRLYVHFGVLSLFERQDQVLDSLTIEALKTRAGLITNFDTLAAASSRSSAFCSDLSHVGIGNREVTGEAFRRNVSVFCHQLERTNRALEHFKQQHAVIINSLHFLAATLTRVEQAGGSPVGLRRMHVAVLRYSLNPTPALFAAAKEQITAVRAASARSREAKAAIVHATMVIEATRRRAALEADLFTLELVNTHRLARAAYLEQYELADHTANRYRLALGAVAVALALFVFLIFIRLQKARNGLTTLNHSLEERVRQRTSQLSAALDELEQKQLQLLQASRLSALGEMAGGIAHEINSPLAAINLQAELIEHGLPEAQTKACALTIQRTVSRISTIILGLKRFIGGGHQLGSREVTLGEIVADTLSFCGEKLRNSFVELRLDRAGDQERLVAQPEQLSQVLLNLVNNAVDAVAGAEEKWVKISTAREGDKLRITIEDSGPGVPVELRAKVGEAFFTTKAPGKGTGLGLSISTAIVRAHKGRLSLDPAAPSRFIVELPAA